MEFQQLEMFAAVVEEGGVTRAADRVCRTAGAVSIALSKLEDELQVTLFDRADRNRQQLTSSGRMLYSYARRILELRQEALTTINNSAQRNRGKFRLGTHESTSLYLLPLLMQPFNSLHPEIKLEILCGTSEHLLNALGKRVIDLALIGDAPDEASFERQLIARDRLVLIVNPAHQFSSQQDVQVQDLANEFLIVQSARSKLRKRLAQAFEEADMSFNIGIENIAIEATKRMVIENIGIGLVPDMCVQDEIATGKLKAVRVEGMDDSWDLWLVKRKGQKLSAAARYFFDISQEISKKLNLSQPLISQPLKQTKTTWRRV